MPLCNRTIPSHFYKIPVPQMVLSTRYGWKPHIDVGTQLYLGGGSMDIRYQFAQVDDWYFAIAPTISGLYAGVYGNVSLQVPIRAQTALNDKWELTWLHPNHTTITGYV